MSSHSKAAQPSLGELVDELERLLEAALGEPQTRSAPKTRSAPFERVPSQGPRITGAGFEVILTERSQQARSPSGTLLGVRRSEADED